MPISRHHLCKMSKKMGTRIFRCKVTRTEGEFLRKQYEAHINYLIRHQATLEARCQDYQEQLMDKVALLEQNQERIGRGTADC